MRSLIALAAALVTTLTLVCCGGDGEPAPADLSTVPHIAPGQVPTSATEPAARSMSPPKLPGLTPTPPVQPGPAPVDGGTAG